MAGGKRSRSSVAPHEDYGFFGPDSVTWKVWSYPTSLTIGFQRSVVVEELDPALIAAVDETRAIRDRPRTRYDRTLRYFAMVAFGDTRSTSKAADVLVKIHSKAIGIEPGSGAPYDANDPHSQLWIHLTAWHSILYAYEKYGPGKLSAADEARYWTECAIGAELQTCDPADVPRSREGIQAYFAEMRPKLVGSAAAQSAMDHLLHAEIMLPPLPLVLRPAGWIIARFLRVATIATMPPRVAGPAARASLRPARVAQRCGSRRVRADPGLHGNPRTARAIVNGRAERLRADRVDAVRADRVRAARAADRAAGAARRPSWPARSRCRTRPRDRSPETTVAAPTAAATRSRRCC
jgi:uncharacterized protein (DUF2236 family)